MLKQRVSIEGSLWWTRNNNLPAENNEEFVINPSIRSLSAKSQLLELLIGSEKIKETLVRSELNI